MKSFIAFALMIGAANAAGGGFAYNTVSHAAPVTYAAPAVAAPVTYAAPAVAAPVTYAAPAVAAPVAYAAAPAATVSHYQYHVAKNVVAAPVAAAPAAVAYTAAAPAAVAYTAAAPAAVAYTAAAPVAVPVATKTQYHAQDVLGQASYGYSYPGQTHQVVRDAAGNERGSYAYINPEGAEIRVNYVAGHGGFRAESNALPQAPLAVAPAVAAAPVVAAPAFATIPAAPAVPADTPEVVEARIAHAHAHAEARARNLVFRKKRGAVAPVVAYNAAVPAATALTYAAPLHHTYAAAIPAHGYAYTAAVPAATALTYAAPVHHTYTAATTLHHAAPVTYAAAAIAPATYTQIHNNPGHAVSYRVY